MHISGLLFLSNLFSTDMLVIVFFALLLFGGEKLPEIARGLGKGIRDFKDASDGIKREINNQIYSFEEKREEDKRIEAAITANQLAAQNKLPESTEAVTDTQTKVQNTIPVSTGYIHTGETAEEVVAKDNYTGQLNEEQVAETHTGAGITTNDHTENL